jgi:hypothetical protein
MNKHIYTSIGIKFIGTCKCTTNACQNNQKSILILNAKAHIGNGKVIENSALAFKDGKITMIADATVIRMKSCL